jgi:hypothetical protein
MRPLRSRAQHLNGGEADRQLAAEGKAAAEAGKQLGDCPYDAETWEAHAWRVAFAKRRIEQRASESE